MTARAHKLIGPLFLLLSLAAIVAVYGTALGEGKSQMDVCGEDNFTSCHPGDANGDGLINITDAVFLIHYIFDSGPAPRPWSSCSGDANADCLTGITDVIYLIQYIFSNGPLPKSCEVFLMSGCNPGSYNPGPWDD